MKKSLKLAAAGLLGAAALAMMASSASAAIACNAAGQCWHVHRAWAYPPAAGIIIHPDGWVAPAGGRVVWREHVGRGYWRDGVWIRF